MVPLRTASRSLQLLALAAAAGAAAWGAWRWRTRAPVRARRAFAIEYEAVARGLLTLAQVRPGWVARLQDARARFGDQDSRTLVVRCRLMAFDELAGDIRAAAEQIDAVLPHVARLDSETRALFVVGLHWLEWHRRRRAGGDRCRAAFAALADATDLNLDERVMLGFGLARTAGQTGRLAQARWILERVEQLIATPRTDPGTSPYRSSPREVDASWSSAEMALEVRCERVRLETRAGQVAAARMAMAELDRWVESVPHAANVVAARQAHWHGAVRHCMGDYAVAERLFAEAEARFEALDPDDVEAAFHRQGNAIAHIGVLLDLQRAQEAAALARRVLPRATHAAQRGPIAAALVAALVQLGQDDEAAAVLVHSGLTQRAGDGADTVLPTRALLALRKGATVDAQRFAYHAWAQSERGPHQAAEILPTLGRALAASGRPSLGERAVRGAAQAVIATLGPAHPLLVGPYRFLAARARARGKASAAASLDEAAELLLQRAARA